MSDHVTLTEAATFLGVSKATLRNWDKTGKLQAVRHPVNDYRVYNIAELKSLREKLSLLDAPGSQPELTPEEKSLSPRDVRQLVSRLHNIMRDTDADSSLVARFDELTKLLFLALHAANSKELKEAIKSTEKKPERYASELKSHYEKLCQKLPFSTPDYFKKIKCSDIAIHECGKALSIVDLSKASVDVKGLAYEEMIKKTFDKTDNQQFFTPPQIVTFMVDFFAEHLKGAICDPASGTGGFLVEIARRKKKGVNLSGFEIDKRLAWVTGINTYIHGAVDVTSRWLEAGGTLGPDALKYEKKYDVIFTNPPFGSDYSDSDGLTNFRLGSGKSSRRRGILFIERCWQLLTEGGRLAIIIDEGVLNLPHAQDVRQFIIRNFDIEAIVSLPESAFMPYASVNSSILFLKKSSERSMKKTFYAKAEQVGRKPNGDDDVVYKIDGTSDLASDLPAILENWQGGASYVADPELSYWTNIFEYANEESGYRMDFRFHHPSRSESQKGLETSKFPLMSIAELCSERKDTLIPSKEMPDSVISYTGLAHIETNTGNAVQAPTPTNSIKSSVKRYCSGDVLFARMRPNLRKVALMEFADGGYTSPECIVLTPIKNGDGLPILNAGLLSIVLRSDFVQGQITHLTAGIGRPRLNAKDLRRVLIPVPPTENQENILRHFKRELESARLLKTQALRLTREAQSVEDKAVDRAAKALSGLEDFDE